MHCSIWVLGLLLVCFELVFFVVCLYCLLLGFYSQNKERLIWSFLRVNVFDFVIPMETRRTQPKAHIEGWQANVIMHTPKNVSTYEELFHHLQRIIVSHCFRCTADLITSINVVLLQIFFLTVECFSFFIGRGGAGEGMGGGGGGWWWKNWYT